MAKKVYLVYQDCAMCGRKEDEIQKIAKKGKLDIVKVPFFKTDGKKLIWKAFKAGIGSTPFFTDGEKFSYSLEDFVDNKKGKKNVAKK